MSPSLQRRHYLWQCEFFRRLVRHVCIVPFLFPSSFSDRRTRAVRPWSCLAEWFRFNLCFHFKQLLLFLFSVLFFQHAFAKLLLYFLLIFVRKLSFLHAFFIHVQYFSLNYRVYILIIAFIQLLSSVVHFLLYKFNFWT